MSKQMVVGSRWLLNTRIVEIDGSLTTNQLQVRDAGDGRLMSAYVHELKPLPAACTKATPMMVAQEEWNRALSMARAFAPYVGSAFMPRPITAELAKRFGLSERQILRYRAKFQEDHLTTSLVRRKGGRQLGTRFLDARVEQLIQHVIDKHYARRERSTKADVCERVRLLCGRLRLQPPDQKTVDSRIKDLNSYKLARKQQGAKSARQAFEPRPGKLTANAPLQLIQIDHTLVDLMLVDDNDPSVIIGRPWLTLAIDVASRAVLGYYLTMDPPSAVSVAMCLAHVMQPKSESGVEIDSWPMYGKPSRVLVDNGKDFRSGALRRGCEQHGIDLKWRPVRRPHFGAHIERLMGTFMRMVHTLPGTTFSNIKAKGDYPSERKACFTLEDFRAWLVEKICRSYHVSEHRGLGEAPLLAWERAFRLEDGTFAPPPIPASLETLRTDFFPFKYRRVQRTGIQFKDSRYWSDALAPLIQPSRQLAVHYHPYDASMVWVRTDGGCLIEARVVAGKAIREGCVPKPSPEDMDRLDSKKLRGYERTDAIEREAIARKRRRHPGAPQATGAHAAAKSTSEKRTRHRLVEVEHISVPLSRTPLRTEVLDQ